MIQCMGLFSEAKPQHYEGISQTDYLCTDVTFLVLVYHKLLN